MAVTSDLHMDNQRNWISIPYDFWISNEIANTAKLYARCLELKGRRPAILLDQTHGFHVVIGEYWCDIFELVRRDYKFTLPVICSAVLSTS